MEGLRAIVGQWDGVLVFFLSSAVGIIVAFVRAEAKIKTLERDVERQDKRQDDHERKLGELDDKVFDKLSNIERIVANIQGQLIKS